MPLFDRIDRLADTKEKRICLLRIFAGMFWLWQLAWCLLLFGRLAAVQSLDHLFQLQSSLESYTGSWLTRTILQVVSSKTVTLTVLFKSVQTTDVLAFLATLLVILSHPGWKFWLWLAGFAGLAAFSATCILTGFSVLSLSSLAGLLVMLGWTGLVWAGILSVTLLVWIFHQVWTVSVKSVSRERA